MIDHLILILLLVVIAILFWLGRSYATINTTEQWQESALKNYERGYEDAIDKACEWLEQNAYHYCDDIDTLHESALIGDFRKAMKGE